MMDMLAKMRLEEESMEQETPADTNKSPKLHQQSPTPIKRKFQKIQSTTQCQSNMTAYNSAQSMVSSLGEANQGP
jgi:hypothetical protein